MGDVAYHRDGTIVVFARERDHTGLHFDQKLVEAGIQLGGRVLIGAQNPVSTLEQVGTRPVDAVHFGTCHRMAGNEEFGALERLLRIFADARLGGCGIGDNPRISPPIEHLQVTLRSRCRGCDDGKLAPIKDVVPEFGAFGASRPVDPPLLERDFATARLDINTVHGALRNGLLVRGRNGCADQAQADNRDFVHVLFCFHFASNLNNEGCLLAAKTQCNLQNAPSRNHEQSKGKIIRPGKPPYTALPLPHRKARASNRA